MKKLTLRTELETKQRQEEAEEYYEYIININKALKSCNIVSGNICFRFRTVLNDFECDIYGYHVYFFNQK